MESVFYISLFCNFFMISVALITNYITYPSFYLIKIPDFISFHKKYTEKIFFIVAPVMIFEIVTTLILTLNTQNTLYEFALLLLVFIWFITFLIIVPIHNQIGKKYNEKLIKGLISYNGYRTILWMLKFIILCFTL